MTISLANSMPSPESCKWSNVVRVKALSPQWGVANAGPEQNIQNARQDRIADVSVLPGHGARLDASPEARSHAQIGALHQLRICSTLPRPDVTIRVWPNELSSEVASHYNSWQSTLIVASFRACGAARDDISPETNGCVRVELAVVSSHAARVLFDESPGG